MEYIFIISELETVLATDNEEIKAIQIFLTEVSSTYSKYLVRLADGRLRNKKKLIGLL